MNIQKVTVQDVDIAVITGSSILITDTQSALDLLMEAKYAAGAHRLAIDKAVVSEEFFILSSGIAGEILQKFINYHVKAAFFGDYSHYTSKPLRDFIYESNQGKDIFFVSTREEALQRLAAAK